MTLGELDFCLRSSLECDIDRIAKEPVKSRVRIEKKCILLVVKVDWPILDDGVELLENCSSCLVSRVPIHSRDGWHWCADCDEMIDVTV